jgi:hypothetical protein
MPMPFLARLMTGSSVNEGEPGSGIGKRSCPLHAGHDLKEHGSCLFDAALIKIAVHGDRGQAGRLRGETGCREQSGRTGVRPGIIVLLNISQDRNNDPGNYIWQNYI